MQEQQYFILSKSSNQPAGPMYESEIRQRISQNLFAPNDLIARAGDPNWISISQSSFAPLMKSGSYPSANREMGRPNEYLQNYQLKPQPDNSILLIRWVALLIDGLISVPLFILAFLPIISLIGTPLLVAYLVSRDALMGNGQSIGKRAMGLKVEKTDHTPFMWADSFKRNIVYLAYLAFIVFTIPYLGWIVGFILMIPVSILFIVETILVVTTGKRIGDNLGTTFVTRAE